MEESTMHDKLWFKPNAPLQKVKWPQNLQSHVTKQPFLCRCHISYINSPELNHCGISCRNMNAQYWYFTKCVNKSQYICSNLANSMSLWPQCTALLQRQDFYFQKTCMSGIDESLACIYSTVASSEMITQRNIISDKKSCYKVKHLVPGRSVQLIPKVRQRPKINIKTCC